MSQTLPTSGCVPMSPRPWIGASMKPILRSMVCHSGFTQERAPE
jgi:hypothetical protein